MLIRSISFFNRYRLIALVLLMIVPPISSAEKTATTADITKLDKLYHQAMMEYNRKNFDDALPLFKNYFKIAKKNPYKRMRLIWVIDHVGRIHLTEQHNPEIAIDYFRTLINDPALNEEEYSDIEGWLAAAIDWKQFGKLPIEIKSADGLYIIGNRYYQKALSKLKFPSDNAGNADFHIAASYLIPLIVNFDNDNRIGEALYMMGDIRRHVRTDNLYWSENFYVKEVIRRFSHTLLAEKAWEILDDEINFAYSGSSGNNTPREQRLMLQRYKKLASPIPEKSP